MRELCPVGDGLAGSLLPRVGPSIGGLSHPLELESYPAKVLQVISSVTATWLTKKERFTRMANPRSSAPRKRPAQKQEIDLLAKAGSVTQPPESTETERGEVAVEAQQEFLRTLHADLIDQRSLSEGEVDSIMAYFRDAIEAARIDPQPAQKLDVGAWIEQLERLAEGGSVGADDQAALLRQISQLKESCEDQSLQLALEYSERLQRDGEQEAMKWLADRQADQTQFQVQKHANELVEKVSSLKQSVTRSRSRRLRGPPGAS